MPYFVTDDDCRLFYEREGQDSGKPGLVFLSGTMQTTLNWRPLCGRFREHYRVLMYDGRAQGRSEPGQRALSLEEHAADLKALMEHLGVEEAHMAGISHGAGVALACAALHPERVNRVLICSAGERPTLRARLLLRSWQEILDVRGLEAMVRAFVPVVFGQAYLASKAGMLDGIVRGLVKRNRVESLKLHLQAIEGYPPLSLFAGGVNCPSVVVSASDDPLVSKEVAGELAALCGGRHEHMAGIGHSVPAEAPERFSRLLADFMEHGSARA